MAVSRILEITAQDTYPLRSLVLRNTDVSAPCPFEGDLDKTTHHFGCIIDGEIAAIASFYRRRNELFADQQMIQLRGMATHPDYAGQGWGKKLMRCAMDIFRNKEIDLIWCNARQIAIPFYEKMSFKPIGEKFEIPNIGTHIVMYHKFEKG